MSEIWVGSVSIATTGEAGVATGSGRLACPAGILLDVAIDYHADAPATTDVTVAHKDTRFGNIVVATSSKTDTVYHPSTVVHDAAGSAVAGAANPVTVGGEITVAVAQCDQLAAALVVAVRILTA